LSSHKFKRVVLGGYAGEAVGKRRRARVFRRRAALAEPTVDRVG
jgi:hypothetical protein